MTIPKSSKVYKIDTILPPDSQIYVVWSDINQYPKIHHRWRFRFILDIGIISLDSPGTQAIVMINLRKAISKIQWSRYQKAEKL